MAHQILFLSNIGTVFEAFQHINMPPIHSQKPKRLVEQEGKTALAIAAYRNGQILTINEAAALFDVPKRTLTIANPRLITSVLGQLLSCFVQTYPWQRFT